MPEELLIVVVRQVAAVQEDDDRVRPRLRRGHHHDRLGQGVHALGIRLHIPHVDGEQPPVEHRRCCHAPFFLSQVVPRSALCLCGWWR